MEKKPKPSIQSKKHIARLQRERTQANIIRWVAFAVVVFSVVVITYGILDTTGTMFKITSTLTKNQTVAVVNGEKISTADFQTYVRLQRQSLIAQYAQMQFYAQMFGYDPAEQVQQIAFMMSEANKENMGQSALDSLIEDVLIRQEVEKRGLEVSEDEIEAKIRENYGFFPDGTPTPAPTSTPLVYSTLSPQQLKLVTVTPTPTLIPTQTPDPDATATPAPSPTATEIPQPTATPYTLEAYQQTYTENLERYSADLSLTEAAFRTIFASQIYRQKLLEDVTKDAPRTQEMVWARHILVKDEAIAKVIRQRLVDGEDFAALAAEASEDPGSKESGGDLGWFAKGQMVAAFETAAFSLKIGEISQPVQSDFGYHIIQVLGQEDRPMTAGEYEESVNKLFDEWLDKLRADSDITTFDERWKARIPMQPEFNPQ